MDTGFALGAAIAAVLFVPALTGALGWLENRRSGESARQRELLGGKVACGLARAFGDSVWTLWLTMLALPFGRIAARPQPAESAARAAAAPIPPPLAAPTPTAPQPATSQPGTPESGTPQPITPQPAITQHDGQPLVILVHGLYHNPAAWFVLRRRLARAGFAQVRVYGYASFHRDFEDIAAGLTEMLLQAGREAPGGRVALVGHSLGGLVIRAACADPRLASGEGCSLAGVVTLGTPHRGSTLAGVFGVGRLAHLGILGVDRPGQGFAGEQGNAGGEAFVDEQRGKVAVAGEIVDKDIDLLADQCPQSFGG